MQKRLEIDLKLKVLILKKIQKRLISNFLIFKKFLIIMINELFLFLLILDKLHPST